MLTGDMLRRSTERFPNKPAVLWQNTSKSYCELNADANRLANALIDSGVAKGAKVGIVSRNRPEYATAFFGVARSGAVLVNVSVLYASEELQFVLDKADVEVLLIEDIFLEKLAVVPAQLPKLKSVFVSGERGGSETFESLFAKGDADYPSVEISEDDPFCMTYTGGTTGRPKGVLCSHRNRMITAHTVAFEESIDERDIVGIVTPMFHVAALNIMFQPAMLVGATVTLLSKWNVSDFAAMARDTKMTAAFMVPTQAAMVISAEDFDAENFATFTKLSFAGAPMPDWVQRDLLEKLPHLKLTQI